MAEKGSEAGEMNAAAQATANAAAAAATHAAPLSAVTSEVVRGTSSLVAPCGVDQLLHPSAALALVPRYVGSSESSGTAWYFTMVWYSKKRGKPFFH